MAPPRRVAMSVRRRHHPDCHFVRNTLANGTRNGSRHLPPVNPQCVQFSCEDSSSILPPLSSPPGPATNDRTIVRPDGTIGLCTEQTACAGALVAGRGRRAPRQLRIAAPHVVDSGALLPRPLTNIPTQHDDSSINYSLASRLPDLLTASWDAFVPGDGFRGDDRGTARTSPEILPIAALAHLRSSSAPSLPCSPAVRELTALTLEFPSLPQRSGGMGSWRSVCLCASPCLPHRCSSAVAPLRAGDIYVAAGANLQAAIDGAQPGDRLLLAPGATFTGNFRLPNKGAATTDITIRSAAADTLAAARRGPHQGPPMPPTCPSSARRTRPRRSPPTPARITGACSTWSSAPTVAASGTSSRSAPAGGADHAHAGAAPSRARPPLYPWRPRAWPEARHSPCTAAPPRSPDSYIADIKGVGMDTQAINGYNGPGPLHHRQQLPRGGGRELHARRRQPENPRHSNPRGHRVHRQSSLTSRSRGAPRSCPPPPG